MTALQPVIADLVVQQRLADLEATRRRLPLTDPDRHDLDPVDVICRRFAPTSNGGHA